MPDGTSWTLGDWVRELFGGGGKTSRTTPSWNVRTPAPTTETKAAPTQEMSWMIPFLESIMGGKIAGAENLTTENIGMLLNLIPYIQQQQQQAQQAKQWEVTRQQIEQQAVADYAQSLVKGQQSYMRNEWASQYHPTESKGIAEPWTGQQEAQRATVGANLRLQQANDWAIGRVGAFEQARQQILATTSPRDWVIRQKAMAMENPYVGQETRGFIYGNAVGNPIGMGQSPSETYQRSQETLMNPVGGEGLYGQSVPSGIQKFLGNRNPYGTQQQVQGVIPGWNPPFAQGRPNPYEFVPYAAGTCGTPVETPSGQGWASAPWSVQQQLLGYLEGLGQQPAEMVASMQRMQPNEPSRGTSWKPRLQYAQLDT